MADLHPRLAQDCIQLGSFPLCRLLLMNDRNFPWFILVPDREGIREIYQLGQNDRARLMHESCLLSEFLMAEYDGDKLNVAALGNQVPQLHLHHIVRFESDPAWPGPVWGKVAPIAYAADEIEGIRETLAAAELDAYETSAQD